MSFVRPTVTTLVAWVVLAVSVGASCVPTSARTNARIEDGFDLALVGGGQVLLEGRDEGNQVTEAETIVHGEVGLQFASTFDSGDAFAVQLKIPITLIYTTLDVFYQLPTGSQTFFMGFGLELSAAPGVYAVFTDYVTDSLYISVTPRVLIQGINPQVAIGLDAGDIDAALFLSYLRFFGDGIDIDIDIGENDDQDQRENAILAGASFRF